MKKFDKELFAKRLIANRQQTSIGYCAKYVRLAATTAHIAIKQFPPSAYLYADLLPTAGFDQLYVTIAEYTPEIGDIVVWNKNVMTRHGHIQGYTAKGWISDFLQASIYPNRLKKDAWIKGGYAIFRYM